MVKDRSDGIEIASFAKVNLFLDVLGKREDGYHEIIGLFQTISLHDTIRIALKDGERIEVSSTREIPGENAVERAYRIFVKETGYRVGMRVHIIKRIPMRAGFGGGSSNAATILNFLGNVFEVDQKDLLKIASLVGSDVPFFIIGGTALVKGKGDVVEKLPDLPKYGLDLAVPRTRMETRFAYSQLRESDFSKAPCEVTELYRALVEMERNVVKRCVYNIFQNILVNFFPEIRETLKYLEKNDPIVVLMTGSGTGCFALHEPGRGTFHFVSPSDLSKSSKEIL